MNEDHVEPNTSAEREKTFLGAQEITKDTKENLPGRI